MRVTPLPFPRAAAALVAVFAALAAMAPAAQASRAPCKVTPAAPVAVGTTGVKAHARFSCRRGRRAVSFTLLLQVKQRGRWIPHAARRRFYRRVHPGRAYGIGRASPCVAGAWRARGELFVGGHFIRATSRSVEIPCINGPGEGSCVGVPQPPTFVNGQVAGSGTVRCASRATIFFDLQVQVLFNGAWTEYSAFGAGNFRADGEKPYTFNTRPAACLHNGQTYQYRTLFTVGARETVTKTSDTVTSSC
jgi:hypothetical protein